MQVARFLEQATMSHCYEKNPAVKYKKLLNLDLHPPWVDLHPPWVDLHPPWVDLHPPWVDLHTPWVVKSSHLPVKIAAYLISIGRLLCLAFLYRWCD